MFLDQEVHSLDALSVGIDKFEVGGSKMDIFDEVGGLRHRSGRVGTKSRGVGRVSVQKDVTTFFLLIRDFFQ